MADLILGKRRVQLSHSRARDIARFAFKTAVVIDHMMPGEPFFERSVRHHFAKSLCIPKLVQMWLAAFVPIGSGRLCSYYHTASAQPGRSLEMYVCTYGVGHLVIQVVAAYVKGFPSFEPKPGFEYLGVPFWPMIPNDGFIWPPGDRLRSKADFEGFSTRWGTIKLVS
jgi:hypothetical protein